MRTVLLIDDPGLIRALQGSFLDRADCRVRTASAAEACGRARRERPDLILLVAADPTATGEILEACRRIKSEELLKKTPVVIIVPDPEHPRWLGAAADAALAHPPRREHLLETVRTLLPGSVRAVARRSATLKVAYFHGDDERVGYSKDLAVGGLFLRTRESFAVGDPLQMIFELPAAGRPTIRADGEIVRRIEPDRDPAGVPGIGVRFRKLGSRDRRELERYVGEGS